MFVVDVKHNVAAADAVSVTLNLDTAVVRAQQCGLGALVGLAAELCTLDGLNAGARLKC